MKILKIKLGLLSLLAVLAVSVFLTSCEQDTLNNLEEDIALQEVELNVEENAEENVEENVEERGYRNLSWSYRPSAIYTQNNYMRANYTIDRPGIIVAQVFNCNWKQIGQHYYYVNKGSGTKTFRPSGSAFGNIRCYGQNNYIQIKLMDRNWKEITNKLTKTAKGR